MENYDWIEEARTIAAQCWCDEETKGIDMEVVLADAFAKRLASWMNIAAQNQRNTDYYRDLLIECGETIGEPAFTCDDGTLSDDVLCAKIPEIIKEYYTNGGGIMENGNLLLGRRVGESILIGDNVKVTVVFIRGNQCKIAISCPKDTKILRSELLDKEMEA